MQFVALKECPQGQVPGDIFEATEEAGDVLVSFGAARRAEPSDLPSNPSEPEKPKRRYARRDMTAEKA